MASKCGICHENDAKYRCPHCDLRYCSVKCFKPHKLTHEDDPVQQPRAPVTIPALQHSGPPSQAQPLSKTFAGIENDPDFIYILTRFPLLRAQLQLVYGVTLEPGPDEARSWARQDWYGGGQRVSSRGSSRGTRGLRGRGRGRGGPSRGGHSIPFDAPYSEKPLDRMQHGPWTQEKGDREGLEVLARMRESDDARQREGLEEFLQLCRLRFGQEG